MKTDVTRVTVLMVGMRTMRQRSVLLAVATLAAGACGTYAGGEEHFSKRGGQLPAAMAATK